MPKKILPVPMTFGAASIIGSQSTASKEEHEDQTIVTGPSQA